MSKLHALKEWLAIREAADTLSEALDEPVSDWDVLRLALDGHARISVRLLTSASAKRCKVVLKATSGSLTVPSLDGTGKIALSNGIEISETELLQVDSEVVQLDPGIWDLPMIGGDQTEIERQFQLSRFGPDVDSVAVDGTFLRGLDGKIYQLQDRRINKANTSTFGSVTWFPADRLPRSSELVMRTTEIDRLKIALAAAPKTMAKLNGEKFVSDKLEQMYLAAQAHWKNADFKDRATHPKNKVVVDWLRKRGFSKRQAEGAASLLRPEWAPTGRVPKEP